jgi:hypothetical protein
MRGATGLHRRSLLCVCIAPSAARRANDVRGMGVRPDLPELNLCSNATAGLATVVNAGSTDIPAGFECLTTIGTLDMCISCNHYYFCGNAPAHASNADGETLDAPSYRLVRECTRLLSNQVIGTAGLAHCGKELQSASLNSLCKGEQDSLGHEAEGWIRFCCIGSQICLDVSVSWWPRLRKTRPPVLCHVEPGPSCDIVSARRQSENRCGNSAKRSAH